MLFCSANESQVCTQMMLYVYHREEKTEQLLDTKNEVERLDAELQKLKQEVCICVTLPVGLYFLEQSYEFDIKPWKKRF